MVTLQVLTHHRKKGVIQYGGHVQEFDRALETFERDTVVNRTLSIIQHITQCNERCSEGEIRVEKIQIDSKNALRALTKQMNRATRPQLVKLRDTLAAQGIVVELIAPGSGVTTG